MIQVTYELPASVLKMETRFGRGSLNRWHILFTSLTVAGNEQNIRRGMHTDVYIINISLRAEHGREINTLFPKANLFLSRCRIGKNQLKEFVN